MRRDYGGAYRDAWWYTLRSLRDARSENTPRDTGGIFFWVAGVRKVGIKIGFRAKLILRLPGLV